MRHRQAVHGQRRAGLPDEQRARHGRAGGQRRRRELRHGLALGLLLMRSRLGLHMYRGCEAFPSQPKAITLGLWFT